MPSSSGRASALTARSLSVTKPVILRLREKRVSLSAPSAGDMRLPTFCAHNSPTICSHPWMTYGARLSARPRSDQVESESWSSFLFEHDLFRKPVPTFRDHALRRAL